MGMSPSCSTFWAAAVTQRRPPQGAPCRFTMRQSWCVSQTSGLLWNFVLCVNSCGCFWSEVWVVLFCLQAIARLWGCCCPKVFLWTLSITVERHCTWPQSRTRIRLWRSCWSMVLTWVGSLVGIYRREKDLCWSSLLKPFLFAAQRSYPPSLFTACAGMQRGIHEMHEATASGSMRLCILLCRSALYVLIF
jgi:hypothetical protein